MLKSSVFMHFFEVFALLVSILYFLEKIALAHLNEFPNYYNNEYGLPAFERKLKKINQNM